METNKLVLEKEYSINSLLINSNQRLGLYGLLGLMQDIAYNHAAILGYGYEDMVRDKCFWVLIRQKLKMKRWPGWQEEIMIRTYPKPIKGAFADRNFEVYHNGERIGECATSWMILDAKTRRPHLHHGFDRTFDPGEEYALPFVADKLIAPKDLEKVKSVVVKNSDLDLSNHVNNFKYSQWILDLIPIQYHKTYLLTEYDINFLGEAFLDDEVECFSNIFQVAPDQKNELFFKGVKKENSKTVFLARIIAYS